jgi:hypothetical protein
MKKQPVDIAWLRAELATLRARYDSAPSDDSIKALIRSLETDIAWAMHKAAQRGAEG